MTFFTIQIQGIATSCRIWMLTCCRLSWLLQFMAVIHSGRALRPRAPHACLSQLFAAFFGRKVIELLQQPLVINQ